MFGLERFLNDAQLKYVKSDGIHTSGTYKDKIYIKYALEKCAFNENHTNNDACIYDTDGSYFYKCFHSSCQKETWFSARTKIAKDYSLELTNYWGDAPKKGEGSSAEFNVDDIQLLDMNDILKMDLPQEFMIENFIKKGDLTLFYGEGSIGKSMFFLYLAMCCAQDHMWDGRKIFLPQDRLFLDVFVIPKKLSTIFFQTEDDAGTVAYRLNKIKKGFVDRDGLYFPFRKNLTFGGGDFCDRKFFDFSCDLIKKYEDKFQNKIDLMVIDPLISFVGDDDNSAIIMRRTMEAIHELSFSMNVTPIIIHHPNKAKTDFRGSSDISNAVRNLFRFEKDDGDTLTVDENHDPLLNKVPLIKVIHQKTNHMRKLDPFHIFMDYNFHFKLHDKEIVSKEGVVMAVIKDFGGSVEGFRNLLSGCKNFMDITEGELRVVVKILSDNGKLVMIPISGKNATSYIFTEAK